MPASSDVVRRIVEQTDMEQFTERVLDSFWELPEFQLLHPPRDEVRAWVRWNLDLVNRWLIDGRAPTDPELEMFREQARVLVRQGIPPDLVPGNFRRGARFAWSALLEAATADERPALLESADLLFEYVDRVSRIFSEVYTAAAVSGRPSSQELAARALLHRIELDQPPLAEDHAFAERIGFQIHRAARPFVIAAPGESAKYHAGLAEQLRRRGALAASEGRHVVGLSNRRAPSHGLALSTRAVVAEGPGAIRAERGRGLEELRTVVEVATSRGHSGLVAVSDYLPELLLRRSPRIANLIRARVYGPLDDTHPELARTLDVLVAHNFDRGHTAAALPVHRNTLRDRIHRIAELTGVDLDRADGRGLAWLAWLQKTDAASRLTMRADG